MALTKTIAEYLKEDGTIEPQKDIMMHPLEQAAMLAQWAIHNVKIKLPIKPSHQEELDTLIQNGADRVKKLRDEFQAKYDQIKPEIDDATSAWDTAQKAWQDHSDLCVANGHNPDTFQGDARDALRMPTEVSK